MNSISGKLESGKNDGLSPYENGVANLKQWCLKFKKPTNIFIDYFQKNAKSAHSVYLEIRENDGQKMDIFYVGTKHFDFNVSK